jgi:hypothetical protein
MEEYCRRRDKEEVETKRRENYEDVYDGEADTEEPREI